MIRLFAFALLALLPALPAAAQAPSAAAAIADVHERLLDTISAAIDPQALERRLMAQMHMAMMADKEVAGMEKQYPGTVLQMVEAMRPVMRRHTARIEAMKRPAVLPILKNALSVDQAEAAAAFYASPLGKRLLGSVIDNMTIQQSIAANARGDASGTLTAVIADNRRSASQGYEALSPEEKTAIEAALKNQGWALQMRLAQGEIDALNARLENEPMTPEEDAAMARAAEAVVRKRMAEKE